MGTDIPGNDVHDPLAERYRQVIEQVEEYAIFTLNNQGLVTSWNAGAERVLGFREEDILGQPGAIIFTLEDRDADIPEKEMATARSEGKATDERWHQREDGSRFFASGILTALYDRGGNPDGFSKILRDRTERVQAQEEKDRLLAEVQHLNETLERRVRERTEELERSNARFSQAFKLAPFPAFISTLGSSETFLEVNEAFLAFTRYEREEVVGKSAFDLKMWSSTSNQQKLVGAQKEGRGFRDLLLQLKDSEDNLLDVLLSAEVMSTNGQKTYLKMFYDVTEKRRSDEQMTLAVNSLFAEASWFSQEFVARLNYIRSGGRIEDYKPLELSPREREVLRMVAKGWTNKRISEELGLRQQTVRNYMSNIYNKLGVHSRTEAAVWAREHGLVS